MEKVWAYKKEPDIGFTEDDSFGYNHVFRFEDMMELIAQLKQRRLQGKVSRLAVVAHGDAGRVYLEDGNSLTASSIDRFQEKFRDLRWFLTRRGHFLFAACIAAMGPEGTELLKTVSRHLPGREVVGFTQFGGLIASGLNSPGAIYSQASPYRGGDTAEGELLTDYCQFSKVARDGEIVWWPWEESLGRFIRPRPAGARR